MMHQFILLHFTLRRAKHDTVEHEEARIRGDFDKSIDDLKQKITQELEDKKLEMLEVCLVLRNFLWLYKNRNV